ncbi:MAG: hypothetical protein C0483_18105 [Pirellula sp.]|nr:hypothetical protein [Pirellula sp.]
MKFLRRPKFTLRTALVLLATSAVVMAVYGVQYRDRARQHALAEELRLLGIRTRIHSFPHWGLLPPVDYVEIDNYLGMRQNGLNWAAVERPKEQRLKAADIARLAGFPSLRKLHLQGDVVEPAAIAEIAKLKSLEELIIAHYPLNDEQFLQLAQLKHLRELTLEATEVTDGAIDRLREQLPELEVYDD